MDNSNTEKKFVLLIEEIKRLRLRIETIETKIDNLEYFLNKDYQNMAVFKNDGINYINTDGTIEKQNETILPKIKIIK